MTTDLDQLCRAMHRTVAAIPARFELVATDPITGEVLHRIPVDANRARSVLADLIATETRTQIRRVDAAARTLPGAAQAS